MSWAVGSAVFWLPGPYAPDGAYDPSQTCGKTVAEPACGGWFAMSASGPEFQMGSWSFFAR